MRGESVGATAALVACCGQRSDHAQEHESGEANACVLRIQVRVRCDEAEEHTAVTLYCVERGELKTRETQPEKNQRSPSFTLEIRAHTTARGVVALPT
jgi:hypothetical protein